MVASLVSLSATTAIAQDDARTVLITGSSKGHGLNFVNDYAERGWNVIATCRTPSKADELQVLADQYDNVTIEALDVTDFAGVDALAAKYRGTPIDVLNLNGAINTWSFGPQRFGRIDYEWFEEILKVNVIGQLYVAEAFLEHVAASQQKTIAAMSSQGSSITNLNSSRAPSYRSSKAGLNMLMRAYGEAVKGRGVIVAVIAPGTVDTEDYMNAEDPATIPENRQRMIKMGLLAPRSAIGSMIDLINGLTVDDIRVLHQWDGEVLPW
jgi:NAD(P)-dependent dehydrogenase (short-subunit alcohol dehydrogenase family)